MRSMLCYTRLDDIDYTGIDFMTLLRVAQVFYFLLISSLNKITLTSTHYMLINIVFSIAVGKCLLVEIRIFDLRFLEW